MSKNIKESSGERYGRPIHAVKKIHFKQFYVWRFPVVKYEESTKHASHKIVDFYSVMYIKLLK